MPTHPLAGVYRLAWYLQHVANGVPIDTSPLFWIDGTSKKRPK
jgi:hypothetical protein